MPDVVDNCTRRANSDQRDTDGDGYGNACDPDFDNDGVVTGKDVSALTTHYRSGEQLYDLNGDGVVDVDDLKLLKEFMNGPPGPGRPDSDTDGFADAADACLGTLPGAALLIGGCSAFDVVRRPAAVLDPIVDAAAATAGRLSGLRHAGIAADAVHSAVVRIESSAEELSNGRFAGAVAAVTGGADDLAAAGAELQREIRRLRSEVMMRNRARTEYADHREIETELLVLEMRAAEVEALVGRAHGVASLFAAIGERSRPARVQGRIREVDDLRRTMTLEDGSTILISDRIAPQSVAEGLDVAVQWQVLDSGGDRMGGIGNSAEIIPSDVPDFEIKLKECLAVRVAPVQRFWPASNGPFELHHPDGYRYQNNHLLEMGMGFAAEQVCSSRGGNTPKLSFIRRSLQVDLLYYEPKNGGIASTVIAYDLQPGEHPAMMPTNIKHGSTAELRVRHNAQNCTLVGLNLVCGEKVATSEESLPVKISNQRSRCVASYWETEFDVEDAPPGTFRSATVFNVLALAAGDNDTLPTFTAEGYRVWSPGNSSYPNVMNVGKGQPFAIFADDFWHEDLLYAEALTGTDKPSGLRWPAVTGVRNGKAYRYSCTLPAITRDVLNYCSGANSYYKLPFQGGYDTWLMGQGNNGSFTHNGNQAYAFDFIAPEGTTIRAARRGTVVFVRENQTGNSYSDPECGCMANAVVIRHQDGTEGVYLHMPANGVFRNVGEKVKRGDIIAEVGNTGYSTTAHLHFQEQSPGGVTHQLRFQALIPFTNGPLTCWIPEAGEILWSNQ